MKSFDTQTSIVKLKSFCERYQIVIIVVGSIIILGSLVFLNRGADLTAPRPSVGEITPTTGAHVSIREAWLTMSFMMILGFLTQSTWRLGAGGGFSARLGSTILSSPFVLIGFLYFVLGLSDALMAVLPLSGTANDGPEVYALLGVAMLAYLKIWEVVSNLLYATLRWVTLLGAWAWKRYAR